MRLAAMFAMTIAAAVTVQAGPRKKESLTIYVRSMGNVRKDEIIRAENLADSIFVPVGVRIDWRSGKPSDSSAMQAVAIELAGNTPKTEKPGALAYAMPYERVHIVVFWDRIELSVAPVELLAHVMVHEITHIVEGIDRHSESGIMKARWTDEDLDVMKVHPLTFAADDVELIHRGLAARNSSLPGTKRAPDPGSAQPRQIEM